MFVRALLQTVRSMVFGLRAQLRIAEGRFNAKLHQARADRALPTNYKSLTLEADQVRYVNLSGEVHVIAFDEIVRVEFVREEALFHDMYGPYLETKWNVQTRDRSNVEVMDEETDRRKLVRALVRALPGFKETAVATALASEEQGRWVCFDRRGPRAGVA